jgi:NADPH-dependent curcumin reductase CurA
LATAAVHARFIECGMIEQYNGEVTGLKNAFNIASKRLHVQGVRSVIPISDTDAMILTLMTCVRWGPRSDQARGRIL